MIKKLEVQLAEKIIKKKLTLSVAESCTGGLVGHLITNVSGSSDYFLGGIICYSNQSKLNLLDVKPETIDKFGAVSEQTASEMAFNVCQKFNSDIGVSITGIAGPSGGSLEKPIGLVFIGLSFLNKLLTYQFNFKGNRLSIKKQAAHKAIKLAIDLLNKETF